MCRLIFASEGFLRRAYSEKCEMHRAVLNGKYNSCCVCSDAARSAGIVSLFILIREAQTKGEKSKRETLFRRAKNNKQRSYKSFPRSSFHCFRPAFHVFLRSPQDFLYKCERHKVFATANTRREMHTGKSICRSGYHHIFPTSLRIECRVCKGRKFSEDQ